MWSGDSLIATAFADVLGFVDDGDSLANYAPLFVYEYSVKSFSAFHSIADTAITANFGTGATEALAYHANRLSIPAQVVMPHSTPNIKVEDTQRYGASVILEGENYDESSLYAANLAKQENLHYVHAFNDEDIIAGQGSIAIEMLEQIPDLDYLVVQIGGGEMIAGMSVAAKHLKPTINIVGV